MSIAIKVEHLGKKYSIARGGRKSYSTLRESLSHQGSRIANRLFGAFSDRGGPSRESATKDFWALHDLQFEVQHGQRIGIVGRNGAGKSTLLKILSRITEPTTGRVELHGRVSSLLEVGTGFHPELTGRENISLNATILGMSRKEIRRHFDQIVAFAEVEEFLETPVKRYSSGMYVRLAFAVAAHLDPDILIVDEVLAVGDKQFQDKCLGRMESMSKHEGRTVLFVSHDLDAIQRLCRDAIYLDHGKLAYQGDVASAIERYMSSAGALSADQGLAEVQDRWGSGRARISGLDILNSDAQPVTTLQSGQDFEFRISYTNHACDATVNDIVVSIALANTRRVTVMLVSSDFAGQYFTLQGDTGSISGSIRDLNLAPGDYSITLFLGRASGETLDCMNDVARISVIGGDFFGSSHPGLPEQCSTLTRSNWTENS